MKRTLAKFLEVLGAMFLPLLTRAKLRDGITVLQKVAKDTQWVGATEKIGSVPHILSSADTARYVQEQFETYDKLGKSIGLVLK